MAQTPQSSSKIPNFCYKISHVFNSMTKKPELAEWSNTALTISRAVEKGELVEKMWADFPWIFIRNSCREQAGEENWGIFLLLWKSLTCTPSAPAQAHPQSSHCLSPGNSLLKIICFVQQWLLWLFLSVVLQPVGKADFPSQVSVCSSSSTRLWFPACPGTTRGIYRVGDNHVIESNLLETPLLPDSGEKIQNRNCGGRKWERGILKLLFAGRKKNKLNPTFILDVCS